jgi:hypothetical protein
MAIDSYLRDGAFMPEATAAMGEAFEAACNGLHLANQSNALRKVIATLIIAAARRGEIDPVRLQMEAVARLPIATPPPPEADASNPPEQHHNPQTRYADVPRPPP